MRSDKSKEYTESVRFYSHGNQNNSSKIPILIHLRGIQWTQTLRNDNNRGEKNKQKTNKNKTTRKYTHFQ